MELPAGSLELQANDRKSPERQLIDKKYHWTSKGHVPAVVLPDICGGILSLR